MCIYTQIYSSIKLYNAVRYWAYNLRVLHACLLPVCYVHVTCMCVTYTLRVRYVCVTCALRVCYVRVTQTCYVRVTATSNDVLQTCENCGHCMSVNTSYRRGIANTDWLVGIRRNWTNTPRALSVCVCVCVGVCVGVCAGVCKYQTH